MDISAEEYGIQEQIQEDPFAVEVVGFEKFELELGIVVETAAYHVGIPLFALVV